MMIGSEAQLKMAAAVVATAERQVPSNYRLTVADIGDLLVDNFNDWSPALVTETATRLHDSTWGVAAFHMAEARKAVSK